MSYLTGRATLLVLLAALLLSVYSAAEVSVRTDTSYKYLDLVFEWAPGSCYNFTYCNKEIPNTWTIHGLWPSVNYTQYPVNCAGTCAPDIEGLPGDLVTKMEKKWPNFYQDHDHEGNEKLWKHEWCKHGTCCSDLLSSPLNYFNKALSLYDTISLDTTLKSAGITPNLTTSYTFSALNSTLTSALGVSTFRYWCKQVAKQQVLYRVGLCVGRSTEFNWQDCPGGEFHEKCDQERQFYLIPMSAAAGVFFNAGLIFVVFVRVFWMI